MTNDQPRREAALDPSRSFIVQAPAGSGKTGLLVQRFLSLLTTVEKPESVVAVTFTRKAAGEMRERILAALLSAHSEGKPASEFEERQRELALRVLEHDRRHGWNLLGDASRLQLQTIDSLCAALARQTPVLSESAGSLEVVEDASELYYLAATQTLGRLAEGGDKLQALLVRLGVHFDNDLRCLADLVVRMLAQRDQWEFSREDIAENAMDFWLLLEVARSVLRDVFKAQGRLDFIAITEAAIRVLGSPQRPSDLLYGLDFRIQHLLVDEFQDTSLAQYSLLNALTAQWSEGDGHTLFLVGDPMQSIYRFRGAEVSLFQQTWKEERLGGTRLHPIVLATNFRSAPALVNWVNEQFGKLSAEGVEGAVEFHPAAASRTQRGVAPEWHAFVADTEGHAAAEEVVKLIARVRKQGDVAILVRNRNHLAQILPQLREAEISYQAVEIDELATRQHILDLVALTRAVLHVSDRTAWLACLRAPWCGLSLADLSALAEGERERQIPDLLRDGQKLAALSSHGRSSAIRVGEILSAAVSRAGRLPLRELIEDTWLLLGGPSILRASYEAEDVQTFLGLLEQVEEGGIIVDFGRLEARLKLLFAKGAADENAVQIMTIFRAKGLEFDSVILPRLEGTSQSSEGELLAWDETVQTDGSTVLRVAAKPRKGVKDRKYDDICEARKNKDREELKRLLYVGCTRARNALYLVGNVKRKKDDIETPWNGSFLRLLWPDAEAIFRGVLRGSAEQLGFDFERAERQGTQAAPRNILRSLPAEWQLPRFDGWPVWTPPFLESTPSTRRVTYEWVSDTGRHVGTIAHGLLKRAAESSTPWTRAHVAGMAGIVRAELRRLGVPSDELTVAGERVIRAVTNTVESERGRWILAPHAESRTELPLSGHLADRVVSGTVDRTFLDEGGRRWIIDFKTSEHEGSNLKRFLDEEQRRYRAQLDSYGALLSRLGNEPISLALYFPLLNAWREWQYEEGAVLTA